MNHGRQTLAARHAALLDRARSHFATLSLGDRMGSERGYGLGGIDAIAMYLLERDGTPVERTRDTSWDVLRLLLCRELGSARSRRKVDFGKLEAAARPTEASARWASLRKLADLAYDLECYGDELAHRHRYAAGGLEAVWLHVVNLHHWPLHEVRSLSHEALRFVLSHHMKAWNISIEQASAKRMGDADARLPQATSGTSAARA